MFVYVFLTLLPPFSCVEALLAAGAAVDLSAEGGQTSLFLACEAGRLDCVRVLLSAGADRSRTTTVSPMSVYVTCKNPFEYRWTQQCSFTVRRFLCPNINHCHCFPSSPV